jgi:hypothetical protein
MERPYLRLSQTLTMKVPVFLAIAKGVDLPPENSTI